MDRKARYMRRHLRILAYCPRSFLSLLTSPSLPLYPTRIKRPQLAESSHFGGTIKLSATSRYMHFRSRPALPRAPALQFPRCRALSRISLDSLSDVSPAGSAKAARDTHPPSLEGEVGAGAIVQAVPSFEAQPLLPGYSWHLRFVGIEGGQCLLPRTLVGYFPEEED
jgi:hypothetical protein